MSNKQEDTFLPVPDLKLDDTGGQKNPAGGGYLTYKTVTVIVHGGKKFNLQHETGKTFNLIPNTFVDLPMSLAMEIVHMPNVDIISHSDAQKFIDIAREKNYEVNKDIFEHNAKVKAGETKFIKGLGRVTFKKKKPRLVPNNRPYDHYLASKNEWRAKKEKKRSRKMKRKSKQEANK